MSGYKVGQRVRVRHSLLGIWMDATVTRRAFTALDGREKITVQIDGFLSPSNEVLDNVRPVRPDEGE